MSRDAATGDGAAPSDGVGDDAPNVLWIVVDACRADALSPYGADADLTPAVDGLADEGTVFERAISPAPWTLPSVTSLLTGLYPGEHGATSRSFAQERGGTVVRDLADAGYRTWHLSPKTWLGDWLPQGRGFDLVDEFTGPAHRYFDDGADVRDLSKGVARGPEWYATTVRRALASESPLKSLGNVAAFRLAETTGDAWLDDVRASERAARLFGERLDDRGTDRPFFAYAQLMDPHLPFYVPEEFRSDVRPPGCDDYDDELDYLDDLMDDLWAVRLGDRTLSAAERDYLRARYRDEVAYADHAIGRMLDHLRERGLLDDTLVVVTADHGEHLGERRDGRTLLDHQTSVGLPVLRVPLVARYPGVFDDARRDDLVQPHYLAETVRALAGLDHDPARSLLPGDAGARRGVALAEYDGVVRSHPPAEYEHEDLFARRRAAVLGDWKLDDIAGERRFRAVDWGANEARAVPAGEVPEDVRAALIDALDGGDGVGGDGVGGAGEGDGAAPAGAAGAGGDESAAVPDDVEQRLADLGYR